MLLYMGRSPSAISTVLPINCTDTLAHQVSTSHNKSTKASQSQPKPTRAYLFSAEDPARRGEIKHATTGQRQGQLAWGDSSHSGDLPPSDP
eukprot:2889341-Rhodomonas_salina.2